MDVAELTKELASIPSESERDGEQEVAKYIADFLESAGMDPEIITFGGKFANVVASSGDGEGLMLNGHMDTVPLGDPSLWEYGPEPIIKGDVVYGRGTSDMKGGIASMLCAIKSLDLHAIKPKRRLLVAFVSGEETDFHGSTYLLDKRAELFDGVKYGVIGEGSFTNRKPNAQTAQKGAISFSITFKGKAAHGSRPWLGDNAISKAAKFITAYEKLASDFRIEDKLLGKGTANIGRISGGTAINVVPDSCTVEVDRRIVPKETPEIALEQIKKALEALSMNASVEMPVARPAYRLPDDSEIIKMFKSAVAEDFQTIGATGYTEAELYKAKAGIDSIVFGPGEKEIIHQANEYVPISNLERAMRVYARILKAWCL